MGWIFEEEREGIEGEPARARIFLKLSAISWGLGFLLWEASLQLTRLFAAFFIIGAVFCSARTLFHLITVGIVRLPHKLQGIVQMVVALIGATIPFTFLFPPDGDFNADILIQAFEPLTQSLPLWLPMSFFVYLVYVGHTVASSTPAFPIVRRYLILVAVVFLIAYVGGHGGFDTANEDGISSSAERLDPKSIEGRISMAASYLRLILLGYGTLLFMSLREKVLRRRLEEALRK